MGTTLTGTTPQDTYDSLIKVTDNGPLSGTAKYLSDGLGNDSTLALSTANIGIGTTSVNLSGGASGSSILTISASASARNGILELNGTRTTLNDYVAYVRMFNNGAATPVADIAAIRGSSDTTGSLTLSTSNAERIRIDSAGNVGIGTSSPAAGYRLSVVGAFTAALGGAYVEVGDFDRSLMVLNHTNVAVNANLLQVQKSGTGVFTINPAGIVQIASGIQFPATQVASADANTLDDYEEGTWTPSLGGNTTYSAQAGTYTKIGRQVVLNFAVAVTTLGTGSQSTISGLPFTSQNVSRGGGGVAFVQNPSTAYASINPIVSVSSPFVTFVTSTTAGSWADASNVFTDGSIISGTVTYFV